jgi:2-polyprenyl-3-methyl-5-hydroxy-6-metoxy-1,4-benzoquinol methylase
MDRDFSHVSIFTGYMNLIFRELNSGPSGLKVLDIPDGNGFLVQRLRDAATLATVQISIKKGLTTFANMDERLPFENQVFDAVVCMEGIEHTMAPRRTIGEPSTITKSGGRVNYKFTQCSKHLLPREIPSYWLLFYV